MLIDTSIANSTFNNTNMEKTKYLGTFDLGPGFSDCEIIKSNMSNSEFKDFNYEQDIS